MRLWRILQQNTYIFPLDEASVGLSMDFYQSGVRKCWGIQLCTIIMNVVCYLTCQEPSVTLLPRYFGWPCISLHKTWLMTFLILSWQQGRENSTHQLSHARVVAENPLGQLKGIWCSLMKRNVNNSKYVPRLVTAYCVLHNSCEQQGNACEEEWIVHARGTEETAQLPSAPLSTTLTANLATRIQEALCDYLSLLWHFPATTDDQEWSNNSSFFLRWYCIHTALNSYMYKLC